MAGRVYLVASGQDRMLGVVAARAAAETGKSRPRIAVSYAPVAGDAHAFAFMSQRMARLFPGAVIERFTAPGEEGAGDAGAARAVLDRADLVFVSGGDPTLGAKLLHTSGAAEWMRDASARGVPMMGVSAGAIVLGAFWAYWPEDESGTQEEQEARTGIVPCVGVVEGHVFDTHNEEDDWDELRIVAKLLAQKGIEAHAIGIPTAGALVFHGDGAMEVVGTAPFRLA